jgi:predicted transcriptional regulator
MSADDNFQANKWLSDRGWEKRGAGRPSKQEKLKEERMQQRIEDEFSADIKRMQDYKK